MTNPGEDAATTPPPESGSGSEPTAAGYEAPPIERASEQSATAPDPAYPGYTPPPAYGATDAHQTPPAFPQSGFTPPDYGATGYPPPPPGFGAPQNPSGYPPPPEFGGPPQAGFGGPPPEFGAPYGAAPYGAQPHGTQPYGAQPGFGAPPPYPPQPQYGGPPPYGAPGYPSPYGAPPGGPQNTMAIASLVCSGLAIPLFFACFIFGIPACIAGVVLGIVALNQIKKTGQRGKELAISGIVLGGLILVAGIALGVLIGVFASVSP